MQIWMNLKPVMEPVPFPITAMCSGCGEHKEITKAGDVCRIADKEITLTVWTCSDECEHLVSNNPEAVAAMILEILRDLGIEVQIPAETPQP